MRSPWRTGTNMRDADGRLSAPNGVSPSPGVAAASRRMS
jgi:hypothetical protein